MCDEMVDEMRDKMGAGMHYGMGDRTDCIVIDRFGDGMDNERGVVWATGDGVSDRLEVGKSDRVEDKMGDRIGDKKAME